MRKSVKAQLAKSLTDSMDSVDSSKHRRQVMHVIDEAALLHRVKWGKKCHTKRLQSSMCPMYEEMWRKLCFF